MGQLEDKHCKARRVKYGGSTIDSRHKICLYLEKVLRFESALSANLCPSACYPAALKCPQHTYGGKIQRKTTDIEIRKFNCLKENTNILLGAVELSVQAIFIFCALSMHSFICFIRPSFLMFLAASTLVTGEVAGCINAFGLSGTLKTRFEGCKGE